MNDPDAGRETNGLTVKPRWLGRWGTTRRIDIPEVSDWRWKAGAQ